MLPQAQAIQLAFINTLITTTFNNILFINKPVHQGTNTTLQEIILNIPSKKRPNEKLFHTIDKTWNDLKQCLVTFLPKHENEARSTLAALIPRLVHEQGGVIKKFFHPTAIDACKDITWDPITNTVTSPEDDCVKQILALDPEFNFVTDGVIKLLGHNKETNNTSNPQSKVSAEINNEPDNTSIILLEGMFHKDNDEESCTQMRNSEKDKIWENTDNNSQSTNNEESCAATKDSQNDEKWDASTIGTVKHQIDNKDRVIIMTR